jgi:phospholipid/cholesterol/gamma-HCH transport system substrate-binding protein
MSDPGTPVGVLLSDRESGSDLKETLANLQQTTILLNEDLIAIRSNFLFRPYFKKQEREAKKEARRKEREGE